MEKARNMTLAAFIEQAGAKSPTPGGGAIAALAGALGVSMAMMAARFTTGRKKFEAVAAEIEDAVNRLEKLSAAFLDFIDADRSAYSAVNAAYSMPKDTDEQKTLRSTAIRAACAEAAKPPQAVLASCLDALKITRRLADIANPLLLSDVGVAAEMLNAAAGSAFLNVMVNAEAIRGEEGGGMLKEAEGVLADCRKLAAETAERTG
ncbi:MAG TPA: methenyltetrahydrofolate cyclohydrolase [Planctomycetes bacterium]|nr:methenyltetrahydrofolate cyclohydrolase [Planctomycetota bacterium]